MTKACLFSRREHSAKLKARSTQFLVSEFWNAAHVYAHVRSLKADSNCMRSGVRSSLPPPHRNFYYNPFNVIEASDRRLDSLLSAEQKENADAFPD